MNFEDKVIVFDTNVYLNLYRFSPDYAGFMIDAMRNLGSFVIVPSVVFCEFKRNHKKMFSDRQKSFSSSLSGSVEMIEQHKSKIKHSFNRFLLGGFPDANNLLSGVISKYDEAKECIDEYFENHSLLDLLKDSWTDDEPNKLIDDFENKKRVLEQISLTQLYDLCDKAERRFKDKIPPGYEDEKNKKGIRAYSDYLWWWEILEYCRSKKKSLVLVTDDVKVDWWESDLSSLRKELIAEFKKETRYKDENGNVVELSLDGFAARDFFEQYAKEEGLGIPDAIDVFTNMTDDEYVASIEDSAFSRISSELSYSRDDYLDLESFDHIGDEEIGDWEIDEKEYLNYQTERDGEYIYYYLKYKVIMSTESFDYWGRDDDTKEVITSSAFEHEVEGELIVKVARKVNFCLDEYDDDYESASIENGSFKQTEFVDNNIEDNCDCYTTNTCPICGCELTFENDAGNGYCKDCSKKDDID